MDPGIVTDAMYDVLAADATLLAGLPGGIWSVRPPVGTAYPYMRLRLMPSPNERWTLGGRRILNLRYQVEVALSGYSTKAGETSLARADTLLSDGSFSPSSGNIMSCRREGFPGHTSEEVEGKAYQLVRAAYLVMAQP